MYQRTPRRLRSLVRAALWDQDEGVRERMYQRLKKQKSRMKRELRKILDGTSEQQMILPMGGFERNRSSLLELIEDLASGGGSDIYVTDV